MKFSLSGSAPIMKFRSIFSSLSTAGALAFSLSTASAQTPLLHYTFDDQANPTADSGSGELASGSVSGTFTTNTPGGYSPAAFSSNGSEGNNVSGGDVSKLDGLSAFTIAMWVNLQETPANSERLASKRNGTVADQGYFDFTFVSPLDGTMSVTDLRLQLGIDIGPGSAREYRTADFSLGTLNSWVFLAVTYNGVGAAGSAVDFFLGSESTSVSAIAPGADTSGYGTIPDNPGAFMIGDIDNLTGDRTPAAYFDDVRVYGSVLSAAELESVRLANIPEPTTGLLCAAGAALLGFRRRRND